VIPIVPQPEPAAFDAAVRQKGRRWIARKGLNPNQPPLPGLKLEPYWRACLDDLHVAYDGICAYLCVFIEREAGGVAVEHYVAKSMSQLRLAYEWSNYRLACHSMNTRKLNFDDVMDPFWVKPGMFRLDLVTGAVFPNPRLGTANRQRVEDTIERLRLDSSG
jgi:uncharacterized protein (TIGR02646 family)